MTPPVLHSARLTLGPATPDHAEAFIVFCATGYSRFIGGPAGRSDAWEGAAISAGQWAVRGCGPFRLLVGDAPVGRKLAAVDEGPHVPNDGKDIRRRRHPGVGA